MNTRGVPAGRNEKIRYYLRLAQQSIPIPHVIPTREQAYTQKVLPINSMRTLDGFERMMYAGEDELAWLALMAVAEHADPGPEGWRSLAHAVALIANFQKRTYQQLEIMRIMRESGNLAQGLREITESSQDPEQQGWALALVQWLDRPVHSNEPR